MSKQILLLKKGDFKTGFLSKKQLVNFIFMKIVSCLIHMVGHAYSTMRLLQLKNQACFVIQKDCQLLVIQSN